MDNSNLASTSPRRTALGNATSVLRPRASRLLPGFEEPAIDNTSASASNDNLSVFRSSSHSRAASPIPSKHPSRSNSVNPLNRNDGTLRNKDTSAYGNDLAASFSGLWGKSWSSLQGMASNVLGSDTSGDLFKDKSLERRRRPFEATHSRAQWGPQTEDTLLPGAGSKEERAALVRQKKREELLMSNSEAPLDATARFKRRTSDDFNSTSAPPAEYEDRDALVYIHHVKKEDTLAGISIKYNCQLATLKKANRLWSQDGVQARPHLIIPVDACGIRGRRVAFPDPGQGNSDVLLNDPNAYEAAATPTQASMNFASSSSAFELPSVTLSPALQPGKSPRASSPKSRGEDEPLWRHDSWIILEGQTSTTEIARLPRRELGYFPRSRRRSLSYSDVNDSRLPSLDLSRTSVAVSDAESPSSTNGGRSTRPGSSSEPSRHRRSSSAQKFSQMLVGPGGVGTLGGKGPSAPGPAEDKLNKVFAKHLPAIAPSPSAYTSTDTPGISVAHGATTPTLNKNIENMGVAIEGWMRKLSRAAVKAVEQVPAVPSSANAATRSANAQKSRAVGLGSSTADLIELSNAFEVGEDEDESIGHGESRRTEISERGRQLGPSTSRVGGGNRYVYDETGSSRQRQVRDQPPSRSYLGPDNGKTKGE